MHPTFHDSRAKVWIPLSYRLNSENIIIWYSSPLHQAHPCLSYTPIHSGVIPPSFISIPLSWLASLLYKFCWYFRLLFLCFCPFFWEVCFGFIPLSLSSSILMLFAVPVFPAYILFSISSAPPYFLGLVGNLMATATLYLCSTIAGCV